MEKRVNQMTRFGLILGATCLAATLVLAFTYEVTKPIIEAERKREEQKALKAIIPDADFFKAVGTDDTEYFEAMKGSEVIGYCLNVSGSGYAGYIHMIVGIDSKGVIKGVRILEHQETPGLGSRINETRRGEKEPYFLKQFTGKLAGRIEIKKDIDAITGATISSKAVTDAINKAVTEFLKKARK